MTATLQPEPSRQSASGGAPPILPLMPGDHLSRREFERRFDATPNLKIAELIEGIVYIPATGSFRYHAEPCAALVGSLGNYVCLTPGVSASAHGHIRMDGDNMPQPDAVLVVDPAKGGQARFSADDYIEGAPEFVAEVVHSSASYDLHEKKRVYRRNGVREYLVWRVYDRQIDYFLLREGEFHLLPPDANGIQRSEVFPGLWLDAAAMLNGELVKVNQVLQQGLATPEHTAFLTRLRDAGAKPTDK